ncbi:hypothetical protein BC826DRAFT_1176716 [Russula brevipes]|nr:hypothetical protein BC826DRAFT_1176716 [Russula brevipes]
MRYYFLERPPHSITMPNGRQPSLSEEAEAIAPIVTMDRTRWCPFCDCCLSYRE